MTEGLGLLPSFAVFGCGWGFTILRAWASENSEWRVRQLEKAAVLLHDHAEAMVRILDDPSVPDPIKSALVTLSDNMGDHDTVLHMARSLAFGTGDEPPAVNATVAALEEYPELDGVHGAASSVLVGAMLRWPDTAALLEQFAARVSARPPSFKLVALLAGLVRDAAPGRPAMV